MRRFSYLSVLILAGCVHTQTANIQDSYDSKYQECGQVYQGKFIETQECMQFYHRTDPAWQELDMQEMRSYIDVVLEKHKAGKITEKEARYLVQQKANELASQIDIQPPAVAYTPPTPAYQNTQHMKDVYSANPEYADCMYRGNCGQTTETTCLPIAGGGTRCTTR